jgi:pilus assembly protein CpaB
VMRRRGLLLLAAGLIAAIAAAILVFELSTPPPPPPPGTPSAGAATPIPVEQVVIAAHDIAPRQPVTAADVVTRTYPVGVVQADAIRDPASVISMTATTQIFSGQTLLTRQFSGTPSASSVPPPDSQTIPAGKVAMAFPATGMLESTGAIKAGDHVDIMITLPVSGTIDLPSNGAPAQGRPGDRSIVAQATLQNVTVYGTGLWTPQAAAGAGDQPVKIITFIVDHQEALILKYIKDSGGTIDLVIRSAKDTNPVATDPVSLDYLVDLFRFVTLPPR